MPVNLYNGTTTGFSSYHAFGAEIETHGAGNRATDAQMSRDGVHGVRNVRDASQYVDNEAVLPPLPACERANDYMRDVLSSIRSAGGDGYRGCGLHVHVSNAPIVGVTDMDSANAFAQRSIDHTERTNRVIFQDHPELLGDPMPASELGDIVHRYTYQQNDVNGMQPASRTNNGMCSPLELDSVDNAISSIVDETSITGLLRATYGKFSTINLEPWTQQGTIEFRQAIGTIEFDRCVAWIAFVLNLVDYTRTQRFAGTTTTETRSTPLRGQDLFDPQAHRIRVVYDWMRTEGGISCGEIMMRTGVSENSARRYPSEIRRRLGHADAVVTHTQQAGGGTYGDGNDYCAWEVLRTYQVETEGPRTLQDSVNKSIWGGMSEEHFGWWISRMDELERS